jgi:hypothetical protein
MAKDVDLIFEIILIQVFIENDKKLNTYGFYLNKICCIYSKHGVVQKKID